jgi:hypothetical protein
MKQNIKVTMLVIMVVLFSVQATAQQGYSGLWYYFKNQLQVGGTTQPPSSAYMQFNGGSNGTKGFGLPKVADTGNVVSPVAGLMVYQTSDSKSYYYNGSAWVSSAAGGTLQTVCTSGDTYTGVIKTGTYPSGNFSYTGGSAIALYNGATLNIGLEYSGSNGSLVLPDLTSGGTIRLRAGTVGSSYVQTLRSGNGSIPTIENANTWTGAQSFGSGNFKLNGATSGTITINAGSTTTSHTLTLPSAQGSSNTYLKNDGSGGLSWATSTSSQDFETTMGFGNIAASNLTLYGQQELFMKSGTSGSDSTQIWLNNGFAGPHTAASIRVGTNTSTGNYISIRSTRSGSTAIEAVDFKSITGFTTTLTTEPPTSNRTVTIPNASGVVVLATYGTGSPEGAITASIGALYINTSGGAGTTLYVKESGSGNTGWVGK